LPTSIEPTQQSRLIVAESLRRPRRPDGSFRLFVHQVAQHLDDRVVGVHVDDRERVATVGVIGYVLDVDCVAGLLAGDEDDAVRMVDLRAVRLAGPGPVRRGVGPIARTLQLPAAIP
jgi:hypothetical protein